MNALKENAAPRKHQMDGPPRLNSSRCGTYDTPAKALNQQLSGVRPLSTSKQGEHMTQELVNKREEEFAIIDQVVMQGDLSKLTSEQRVMYYNKVCLSVGLNPMTNPFSYISMQGKLTLYAKKDCTEQLRKINGVSIDELEGKVVDDIYVVTAKASDKTGRIDRATGVVVIGNLKGDSKANAIMKAETKAKRRVTLSICGMGWTDESEIDSIPNARTVDVDFNTGEIKNAASLPQKQPTALIEDKPKIIEDKPKITVSQVSELEMILDECEEKFKNDVYARVKNVFKTDGLSGLTADLYEPTKDAAIKNMKKNYEKLSSESPVEVLAAVAQ